MRALVVVCCLLVAGPAAAQLSADLAAWPQGPEGVLMTDAERTEYAALSTDDAARRFVDLFWARRDPDLKTRENEVRLDFEERVAAADAKLASGGVRGSLTDRGRTLLLLGLPATHRQVPLAAYMKELYREEMPDSEGGGNVQMYGVRFDVTKGVADLWEYSREQVPASVDIGKRAKSVTFAYFDTEGGGDFKLATTVRRAQTAVDVLAALPATKVVNPGLKELPTFPLLDAGEAATEAQLAWLALEPAPWPEGAQVAVTEGVETATSFPAWLFLRLPAATPADLAVGRLTLADGTVKGTFQLPMTGVTTVRGTVYELKVPAQAGRSTLEVALAAQGKPVAVRRLDLELAGSPAEGTYIFPTFAGGEVVEQRQYQPGAPYIFGGYHLILRPEGDYAYTEDLNYFCLVVRPGLDVTTGKPAAKLRVKLKQDGKLLSTAPLRAIDLSPVAPDVYMFGAPLPLSAIPTGGDYELEINLEDSVSGKERSSTISFHLPEKGTTG